MSHKSIFISIFFVVVFLISSSIVAQTDTTKVKDSTSVQTTTTNAPVSGVTIPEGTKLMVNINTPISTAKNSKGSTFSSILEADLVFDGKIISNKGSLVNGKVIESQDGKGAGGAKLTFQFTDITVNGKLTPIVTDPIEVKGGKKRNDQVEIPAGTLKEVPLKAALVIK